MYGSGAPNYGFDFSQMPPGGGYPGGGFPGQMPPGMMPYPQISPYELDYSRTSNLNGLWETESVGAGQGRQMKFRTEYVYGRTERPDGVIGNSNALSYKDMVLDDLENEVGVDTNTINAFRGDATREGFNYYDPARASSIGKPVVEGMKLVLEIDNADGSGFEFNGFFLQGLDAEFDAREDVSKSRGNQSQLLVDEILIPGFDSTDQTDLDRLAPLDPLELLQANLLNLRGIPLDDGTMRQLSNGSFVGGVTAPYDLNFRIRLRDEMYGAGALWKAQPIFKNNWLRINPTAGIRYTNLREHFGLFARDSGLVYYEDAGGGGGLLPDIKAQSPNDGVDNDADGIVDNALAIEQTGGAGGGGGGTTTAVLDDFVFANDFQNIYPVTTIVRSSAYSHLVGPEGGLSYIIGGDRFRIGGKTQFGLMANFEKINLSGDNVFPTTRQNTSNLPGISAPPNSPANTTTSTLHPNNPDPARPNYFSDSKDSTHVSPMIEQSVYIEGPIIQYVPILRRSRFLRSAEVRAGFTYLWLGDVARPHESILWQGNPIEQIYPETIVRRRSWTASFWDFGMTWKF